VSRIVTSVLALVNSEARADHVPDSRLRILQQWLLLPLLALFRFLSPHPSREIGIGHHGTDQNEKERDKEQDFESGHGNLGIQLRSPSQGNPMDSNSLYASANGQGTLGRKLILLRDLLRSSREDLRPELRDHARQEPVLRFLNAGMQLLHGIILQHGHPFLSQDGPGIDS